MMRALSLTSLWAGGRAADGCDDVLRVIRCLSTPIAVCEDATGRILGANSALEKLFGMSERGAEGQAIDSLFVSCDRSLLLRRLDVARSRGHTSFDGMARHPDGVAQFPVHVRISSAPTKLLHGGACLIELEDRSRNRLTEVQLREVLAISQDSNAETERVLAQASHSLRTPLTSIMAWAQFLQLRVYDEAKVKAGLVAIERCAQLEDGLISQFLDRRGGGEDGFPLAMPALERNPTSPEFALRAAIHSIEALAREKDVGIQARLRFRGAEVLADMPRLQQIFWNLLTNAVMHSREGGHVAVHGDLFRREGGLYVRVVVRDQGDGIAEDALPGIFDRQGRSLGLAIVRQLVKQHEGEIKAESKGLGHGARFTVLFPVVVVGVDEAGRQSSS